MDFFLLAHGAIKKAGLPCVKATRLSGKTRGFPSPSCDRFGFILLFYYYTAREGGKSIDRMSGFDMCIPPPFNFTTNYFRGRIRRLTA